MMHFQLMHESLARFSEDFASFLYGLNMNAFCVDFPEGPLAESFRRVREREAVMVREQGQGMVMDGNGQTTAATKHERDQRDQREGYDGETSFMFVVMSFYFFLLSVN